MTEIEPILQKVLQLLESIPTKYETIIPKKPYYNMGATITDAILQAGMNYGTVVYPRIFNILTKYKNFVTTCDFIILFQTIPIEEIIQWKNIKKQNTICELTWYLYNKQINNEDDLAKWLSNANNAELLLQIHGIGYKTIDYLKLLSGLQAIPIDRHMFQFLEIAGVTTSNYHDASLILSKTAEILNIGESVLDKTIWNYMVERKTKIIQPTLF